MAIPQDALYVTLKVIINDYVIIVVFKFLALDTCYINLHFTN